MWGRVAANVTDRPGFESGGGRRQPVLEGGIGDGVGGHVHLAYRKHCFWSLRGPSGFLVPALPDTIVATLQRTSFPSSLTGIIIIANSSPPPRPVAVFARVVLPPLPRPPGRKDCWSSCLCRPPDTYDLLLNTTIVVASVPFCFKYRPYQSSSLVISPPPPPPFLFHSSCCGYTYTALTYSLEDTH